MKGPRAALVILDKPKHPQTALDRALGVTRAAGAHLHLASFCWLPMVTRSDVFDAHQRRAIRKAAMNERRRWLDALGLDRGLTDTDVDTEVVWTDDVAGWVEEHVSPAGWDLVVKSVHHSRALLHTPLDWALLRHAPVPVLLASTRSHRPTGHVLATVDLHSTDARHQRLNRRVLAAAARFAALSGGKLHCVNAVEIDASFEDLEFFDAPRMRRKARDSARRRLEQMLAGYDVAKSRVHLPVGKVGRAVTEVADRIGADLVVVGTGTRRGLGALLPGSSAEKILTRVSCDVLAVPA